MFHMAWFVGNGYGIQADWRGQFAGAAATEWMHPDLMSI